VETQIKVLADSEKDIQEGNTIKQETLFKQIEDKLLEKTNRKISKIKINT